MQNLGNEPRHSPATKSPPPYELAKMPTDDELDAFDPPSGEPPSSGGFGDDDNALKQIKRKTSWTGRIVAVLLILGTAGAGLVWWQNNKKYEARMVDWEAAQNAPSLQEHLAKLREAYPRAEFEDVKLLMLQQFTKYKDAPSVPILVSALSDEAVAVRRQAALALAAIGMPGAAPAKEPLFALLPKADAAERAQVVWALAILQDSRAADAIVQEFGKGTLQSQPTFDPKVITDVLGITRLASLTRHENKGVRTLVAMALSEAGTPEVVDPLITLLSDSEKEIVQQAAVGLGRTGEPRAAAKLFEALAAHPDLRSAILAALRSTTGARGLSPLVAGATDVNVKRELAKMLADTHDPAAADALATLLQDGDADVKRQAMLGLAALGDARATDALLEVAKGTDDPKAREALGALRSLARPEMVRGLIDILHEFPGRRADCLRALAASGSQEAGPAIEHELDGDDIETAARALADLHYEPAYRRVLGMVKRPPDIDFKNLSALNETAYRNRLIAIHTVGRYGKPDALEALTKVVEDPDDEPRLREAAGVAIGLIATPDALREVVAKIRNSATDPVVRTYYTQGLWQRPSREIASQLFELLEPAVAPEVRRAAALVIGYAADPANDARLLALLDDRERRRDAAFAVLLGGSQEAAEKLVALLPNDNDTRDALQTAVTGGENTWFDMLSPEMFASGEVWRRLRVGDVLKRGVGERTFGFAHQKAILALKQGWDGPGGVTARQVREKLLEALRGNDAELRTLVAQTLGAMEERGLLIAARDAGGPGADEARAVLRDLNRASQPGT